MGIQLQGDLKAFNAQFKRLEEFDKSKMSSVLAENLRTSTIQRFRESKSPEGKKWTESKRVKEIGGKTLVDTAGLRNSIHSKAESSGFAIGTNLKYAATHQFGAENRLIRAKKARGLHFRMNGEWVNVKAVHVSIPARPFLGISEEDLQEMQSTMEEYLIEE
ncbi:MAG: phage virion morphogenesis protein [Anaerovoracaceae bacterium]